METNDEMLLTILNTLIHENWEQIEKAKVFATIEKQGKFLVFRIQINQFGLALVIKPDKHIKDADVFEYENNILTHEQSFEQFFKNSQISNIIKVL